MTDSMAALESHLDAWLRANADPDGPAEVDPDERAKWIKGWQHPALSVHWPGAAEQVTRLAALDRERLLAVAADALAAGAHDLLIREAPWALAGITREEVVAVAVRLLVPLDWAELVRRAGQCLADLYKAQVGWIEPDANPGELQRDDCPAEDSLLALSMAVGWKMLTGAPAPDGDPLLDLAAEVGEVVLRRCHIDLVRGRERVLDLWRAGDWDALLRHGEIDQEDYEDLRSRHPGGNPRYQHRDGDKWPSQARRRPDRGSVHQGGES